MRPQGVVVPIVTPLDASGALDKDGLKRLIDHVIEGGVHGVFPAGTTGEFARLDARTRHELFDLCAEYVGGRRPIYAGVTDASIGTVKEHIKAAEASGADVIVASLPYYYTVTTAREAERWFRAIIEAASKPVILYDIPGNVGVSIRPEAVAALAGDVAGMKDSSGSPELLEQYLAALGGAERSTGFLCGSEDLFEEAVRRGADGIVPSMANVFPKLWSTLWNRREDADVVARLMAVVRDINQMNGRYESSLGHVAWKKRTLSLLGVCGDAMTLPADTAPAEDDDLLRRFISDVESALAEV